MNTYSIYNKTSGADLGEYVAANAELAIDAMLAEAGYSNRNDCPNFDEKDLIVEPIA